MRLQERADYLTAKIEADPSKNMAYDAQERSAILWALEQIELLDRIDDTLSDRSLADDSQMVTALVAVMDDRRRPTANDLARTPGLRKTIERNRGRRRAIAAEIRDAARAVTPAASKAP